jgi:hypothetical protein
LRVVTLAEHYGIPQDENVLDTDWLSLCGERGWLALMKDDRIRYVGAERQALVETQVCAAVITNAQLSADVMADRILRAAPELAVICQERQGPFLFALYENRISEIKLDQ